MYILFQVSKGDDDTDLGFGEDSDSVDLAGISSHSIVDVQVFSRLLRICLFFKSAITFAVCCDSHSSDALSDYNRKFYSVKAVFCALLRSVLASMFLHLWLPFTSWC